MPFVCLQFYKHNCLNILASNMWSCISKELKDMTVKDFCFLSSSPTLKATKVSINFIIVCSFFVFYTSVIIDWQRI